ncbi:Structural maintenance of chromosomes protein 2 [Dispira simplex]|nr:Structural maintenance of chromosomes protein 2 [Dispira simplex]
MRVEEVIIDGFKSYAARTHITGWDPEFNSITGLNGSGKSNILDAICFVLGIKNLSHVRAGNLQDLIYKRGQAGITKASVTIVFNNQDREKSPLGYEDSKQISVTRQILIGGKNKYMINGHNAQEQTVANLFQSVQLNINNPHFLIMQGKITKVLNMKAPEILAMIEEAAGTRMFEERKGKAYKTMAKKEKKVEQITSILAEEITPKLDKLRSEKRVFLEYQKLEIEVDRLTRVVVAYDYTRNQEKLNQSDQDQELQLERRATMETKLETLKCEIQNIHQNIQRIEESKAEITGEGQFHELQQAVDQYAKDLIRSKTQCEHKRTSVEEEKQTRHNLMTSLAETEAALEDKHAQLTALNTKFETIKAEYDQRCQEVRQTEELIQTLTTGVAAEEGHESGYMEQLQHAKNTAVQAATAMEQARGKIKHLTKQMKELEPEARKAAKENQALLTRLETERDQHQKLQDQLTALQWDPATEQQLRQREAVIRRTLVGRGEERDQLGSQLASLDFVYADPTRGFDRSTVKGLVANLITLDSAHYQASTALEICAGGRLYNVVVDNEAVGTQLLKHGKLRRRVTILPLNQIQAFRVSAERVAHAKRIAPGDVHLALELVGYEDELEPVMQYVFGGTLVCKDPSVAEAVAFNRDVRVKAVTWEGDVYDPAGTMQGGSKPKSSGLLVKLQRLHQLQQEIASHQSTLDAVTQELAGLQTTLRRYNDLNKASDLKRHEIGLLEDRIAKTTHAQLLRQLEEARTEQESMHQQIAEAETTKEQAEEKRRHIEKEMAEFKKDKTSKLRQMKNKLSAAKGQLTQTSQSVKAMQRDVQTLTLETEQLQSDVASLKEQITTVAANLTNSIAEEEALQASMQKLQADLGEAQEALRKEKQMLRAFDEEIQELDALVKTKAAQQTDVQMELQKLVHGLERYEREREQAHRAIAKLEATYDWIADSKHLFGQPGTAFDFVAQDPHTTKKQLHQLQEQYSRLRRTTNTSVMTNIENVEKREASLKTMLSTVLKDKRKIEETIQSLEKYKRDALEKTWRVVNQDFGSIFGELLAGCSAKLEPPEGQTLLDGLEVKVCLGGVWKQSLTELSGGQRSLVALSLILSLLQFKPAPMYILDEIDSALDLSHTQNIGNLFRTRFKGSQFIVVSLKEGMFNNANVLFRAKFRDGVSMVERITQRQRKPTPPNTTTNQGNRSQMNTSIQHRRTGQHMVDQSPTPMART